MPRVFQLPYKTNTLMWTAVHWRCNHPTQYIYLHRGLLSLFYLGHDIGDNDTLFATHLPNMPQRDKAVLSHASPLLTAMFLTQFTMILPSRNRISADELILLGKKNS